MSEAANPTSGPTGLTWNRWALVTIAACYIAAGAALVTLLEASVLYGRIESQVGDSGLEAVPGRWLFAAGAVLVPAVVSSCTILPIVLFGLTREVGNKVRAQTALEHARSMLERAEQMAQVGHWRICYEPHGARIEWSDSIFRILGHPPQSFVPTPERIIEAYHPDDRDRVREVLARTLETAEPFQFELRAIRKDGAERMVLTQGVAERDHAGRVASVFGVVQDVTEARERDATVREQAERLRVITDGMSDGVVMLDGRGVIVFWNPAAAELFGVATEGALGRELDKVVELREPEIDSTTLDLLPTADRPDVRRMESLDPRGRTRILEITYDTLAAVQPDHRVLLVRDVTRRAETERELRRRARYDELTGLLNRGYFWKRAEEEVERAREEGRPLTLLLVDIDHFKSVNDQRGHGDGDVALARFARCLAGRFRATDLVGRVGGEEFAALLFGADAPRATAAAEKLRTAIEDLSIEGQSGRFSITASVGVAEVDLDEPQPLDDAGRRADDALYRAKTEGRNRIHLAPSTGRGPPSRTGELRT